MTRLVQGALTLNPNCMTKIDFSQTAVIRAVGIDVSKDKLSICRSLSDQTKKITEIRNIDADISKFMKKSLAGYRGKIVMESTGHYHLLSAIKLTENGFDARVINPLITKKYATGSIRKVKSDKRDSELLAEIAIKEERLPERFKQTRPDLEIRKKISLLGSIEKQLQQFNAIMAGYREIKGQLNLKLSCAEKEMFKTIGQLSKAKDNLEKEIALSSNGNNLATEAVGRYETIPGVSRYLAVVAANFFNTAFQADAKQWVAYAGLDVSVRQSGQWLGKGRLTKRGNPYLRKRLFSAAWGAMMHDEQFKRYYDLLRQKGRSYVEALTIISRKIVRIMFILAKNKTVYQSDAVNLPLAN